MRRYRFAFWTLAYMLLLLSACGPSQTSVPTLTRVATEEPLLTSTPLRLTPVESALAPGNPTAAPTGDIVAAHEVTFVTPDGASITGEMYGAGTTAVIFSRMGDCDPGWRELAQQTAAQGLMTLTYPWRGCREAGQSNESELQLFVDDTRGAISFVRERGAERIILVGASLGGLASAKLAIESQASGIVVVAAPPSISEWGFEVEAADLDTDIPKLFMTGEGDYVVPAEETRALYELAAEPKEWQTYPENEHGTNVFKTESGPAMQQRILEFILAIVSSP